MAKKKKDNKFGDEENPDLFKNNEETTSDETGDNPIIMSTESKDKSKDDLYKEVNGLKPKSQFQKLFDENKKAIEGNKDAKRRQLTLADGSTVPYEAIAISPAYAIKKYKLFFMFDMNEEQRTFMLDNTLQWFAMKKING